MGKSIADLGSLKVAITKQDVEELLGAVLYWIASGHAINDQVYQDRYDADELNPCPYATDLIAECNDWGDDGCSVCTNNKCSRANIQF